VRCGQGHVDVARLLDRLAAVERLEHCQLARALLQQPRDAEEVLGPLRRPQLRPRPERRARGRDRQVDVLVAGLGHLGQRLLRGGVDRGEALAGAGLDELAADEQVVRRRDRHEVARLARRGVLEAAPDRCDVARGPGGVSQG
jgi:hypothetical protein